MVNRCSCVVSANQERIDFVKENYGLANYGRFSAVENLTDKTFSDLPVGSPPSKVKEWLGKTPFFLGQGGAGPDRFGFQLVESIMTDKKNKLIIVGPFQEAVKAKMKTQWGGALDDWVYFTGFIPQMELVNFLDEAEASIIFYTTNNENSRLCAPNRLYQAICRSVPVIVGHNPPMKNIVSELNCGVVIESDGRAVDSILAGFSVFREGKVGFRAQANANSTRFVWESQNEQIGKIATI